MEHIKTVGNIKVYVTKNAEKDYTISLYNGTDCIYTEVYFGDMEKAIDDSLQKACDVYSQDYVYSVFLEKYSNNTYGMGKSLNADEKRQSWFCRIDDTNYFKHFYKSEDEFIRDKNGMRIIYR